MFNHENCARPPDNWGPGVHHIAIPVGLAGALPSANVPCMGGVYLPFDYDIYGWWWGVGLITGGTSPVVDMELHPAKTDISSTGFSAPAALSQLARTSGTTDFIDLTQTPYKVRRASAAGSWLTARCFLKPGGTAITGLGGFVIGAVIVPISGKTNLALT